MFLRKGFFKITLTTQQQAISKKKEGGYLVLAGAGSGKTFTLIQRIGMLIQDGVEPEEITAVSFTKKASNEIKTRTLKTFSSAERVNFGTFHSLCLKILKNYSSKLIELNLISNLEFTIIDERDRAILINKFVQANPLGNNNPKLSSQVSSFLSFWAGNLNFPKGINLYEHDVFKIWKDIHDEKVRQSYIDFDDILKYTYIILKSYPDINSIVSKKVQYLLVDEAQDLNEIQFKISELLSDYWNNFMLIGDDLQSIYKFRGAKVENFINLSQSSPSVETLKLTQNFRSSQIIVKASNALISLNKNQIPKKAFSDIYSSSLIEVNLYQDRVDEGRMVSGMIKQDLNDGYSPASIAVLFRSRNLAAEIEDNFIKHEIPYYISGTDQFLNLPAIQQIIKTARLTYHPHDELALMQCLFQIEGVDEQVQQILMQLSSHYDVSLARIVMSIKNWNGIKLEVAENIAVFWEEFYKNIKSHKEKLNSIDSSSEKINYCYQLINKYPRKKTLKDKENIDRLINIIEDLFITEAITKDTNIFEILNTINVSYEENQEPDKIGLLTIHSVKGLEFRKVYLIGLESGSFPSFYAVSEEQIEEERRMMYVAMTRAKENLVLSHVRKRYYNGQEFKCEPSQFIKEIPPTYLNTNHEFQSI